MYRILRELNVDAIFYRNLDIFVNLVGLELGTFKLKQNEIAKASSNPGFQIICMIISNLRVEIINIRNVQDFGMLNVGATFLEISIYF